MKEILQMVLRYILNADIDRELFLTKYGSFRRAIVNSITSPMKILLLACTALFLAGNLTSCCCRHAPEITDLSADSEEMIG